MELFSAIFGVWMWLSGALLYINFVVSIPSIEKPFLACGRIMRTVIALSWPILMAWIVINGIFSFRNGGNDETEV